jgi:hypothetical protein
MMYAVERPYSTHGTSVQNYDVLTITGSLHILRRTLVTKMWALKVANVKLKHVGSN